LIVAAALCGLGLEACGGSLEAEDIESGQGGITTQAYATIARGTVPGIPSELSGATRGDGYFFMVHRTADWRMAITQLVVDDWARGTLRRLAQGIVSFNDPEGLSYIDKVGSARRFVAAAEGGSLSIVEMNGNTVTVKATKKVGTYGNDGIEGVCYYAGYIYYGIQRDGKVYRVRFNAQTGTMGDPIESVPSTATSVRDMTVIGSGLYALNGTRLTRIAGTGATEPRFRSRGEERMGGLANVGWAT
jgi:hypothetical protein